MMIYLVQLFISNTLSRSLVLTGAKLHVHVYKATNQVDHNVH
jgi:hypothetical protein